MNNLKHVSKNISKHFNFYSRRFYQVQLSPNSLQNEMISKLKSRDIEYFINKTELEGLPKTIVFLANLPVDDTKYGRELIQTRDEVVKKLVYLERTVEEHENVSSHICEREIPNIYNEHIRELQENQKDTRDSGADMKIVYEYIQKRKSSKYYVTPFLFFAIPSSLAYYYKFILTIYLGNYAPLFVYASSLYAAYRRYIKLTTKLDGELVTKLSFDGSKVEIESRLLFTHQKVILPLNDLQVNYIENGTRNSLYHIKNTLNNKIYVVPIDENCSVNFKLLNWLMYNNKFNNDDYDISNALLNKKYISDNNISDELDNMARIKLLKENPSSLSAEELNYKLKSIPDNVVAEYLEQLRTTLSNQQLPTDKKFSEFKDFLLSLGANAELALKINTILKIDSIEGMKYVKKEELLKLHNSLDSQINFENFYANLEAFIKTYNK